MWINIVILLCIKFISLLILNIVGWLINTGMTRDTWAYKNTLFCLLAINIKYSRSLHCIGFLFICYLYQAKVESRVLLAKDNEASNIAGSIYLRKPIKRSRIIRRSDARTLHRQNIRPGPRIVTHCLYLI